MAASGKKGSGNKAVHPERDVYTLSDLDQVKVLADPLRVRILEALGQERTTKQVADVIGEKPTKLYHHVEALERVGLIRMTRTKQNRGTLEKYFLAVAKSFRTDSKLFAGASPGGPETEVLQAVAATAFDKTAAELREVIARCETDLETEGALSYCEIHAPLESMKLIRAKIEKLMEEILELGAADDDNESEADQWRYRLTLAFFPLEDLGKKK